MKKMSVTQRTLIQNLKGKASDNNTLRTQKELEELEERTANRGFNKFTAGQAMEEEFDVRLRGVKELANDYMKIYLDVLAAENNRFSDDLLGFVLKELEELLSGASSGIGQVFDDYERMHKRFNLAEHYKRGLVKRLGDIFSEVKRELLIEKDRRELLFEKSDTSASKDKLITPQTPFTNRKKIWETIRECKNYIRWVDLYFTKTGLEALADEVKPQIIREIKILSGLKQTNDTLRGLFMRFREEMVNKSVSAECRIITDNKISSKIHDRWLISEDKCFNLPSTNTIDRGQFSEIIETSNRPPFDDWWQGSKDIIRDWNEIKKLLDTSSESAEGKIAIVEGKR